MNRYKTLYYCLFALLFTYSSAVFAQSESNHSSSASIGLSVAQETGESNTMTDRGGLRLNTPKALDKED